MTVNWLDFTPLTSLAGGLLIGLSAGGLILLIGRIAGISGILGGLLSFRPGDKAWRIAFLLGLIAAPAIYTLVATMPAPRIDAGWPALLVAGLLVGVGTRYAAGCTSGHGVCGLSRLSPRSAASVACFMGTGFLTVFVTRHLLGL